MYYNIKEEDSLNKNEEFLKLLKENSYFTIKCKEYDRTSFIEYDIPIPNLVRRNNNHYIIMYIVDGYFGTKKGKEYFNDVKTKITKLLDGEYLPYFISEVRESDVVYLVKCFLSDFEHIENYKNKNMLKRLAKENEMRDKIFQLLGEDNLFEASRWEIYQSKIDGSISYENSLRILEEKANLLNSNKSMSDLKSKAKNITEWTEEFYNIGKHSEDYYKEYYNNVRRKKEERMSKSEQLKLIAEMKKINTQNKILEGIENLLNSDLKFNKSNLSKMSSVSRITLNKYSHLFSHLLT